MSEKQAKAERRAEKEAEAELKARMEVPGHAFIQREITYRTNAPTVTTFTEHVPCSTPVPAGFKRFSVGFAVGRTEPKLGPFPLKRQFTVSVDAASPMEALVRLEAELARRRPIEEAELESEIQRRLLSGEGVDPAAVGRVLRIPGGALGQKH